MTRGILIALLLSLCLVAAATAAVPNMTGQGQKSLTFEADTESPMITFGWNIAEMTKFNIGAGVTNNKPAVPEGQTAESTTTWDFQVGISRYLSGISSNVFAPYIGAQVNVSDNGPNQDTNYGFRGFFGVEAFVVESLSIGGNIGVSYTREGDWIDVDDTPQQGESRITTSSSAILATLYW
jgi:hypothetical protein